MVPQITPESFFDSLFLASKLAEYFGNFKLQEVHLFSYFSSLLFTALGNAPSEWEHRYIVKDDYPFSDKLQNALDRHIIVGLLEEENGAYDVTTKGVNEINNFTHLQNFQARKQLLQAVCTSSILMTYSATIKALLQSPDILRTQTSTGDEWIYQDLSNGILGLILKELDISSKDPLIPAISWIEYLSQGIGR